MPWPRAGQRPASCEASNWRKHRQRRQVRGRVRGRRGRRRGLQASPSCACEGPVAAGRRPSQTPACQAVQAQVQAVCSRHALPSPAPRRPRITPWRRVPPQSARDDVFCRCELWGRAQPVFQPWHAPGEDLPSELPESKVPSGAAAPSRRLHNPARAVRTADACSLLSVPTRPATWGLRLLAGVYEGGEGHPGLGSTRTSCRQLAPQPLGRAWLGHSLFRGQRCSASCRASVTRSTFSLVALQPRRPIRSTWGRGSETSACAQGPTWPG